MKHRLSNENILNLWHGLQMVSGKDRRFGIKFAFAVAKTKVKLRPTITALQEVLKPIAEYEKRRIALVEKYAIRDENGAMITLPDGGHPLSDMAEFEDKLQWLKEATGQDVHEKEIEELLKTEDEVELHMCSINDLPPEINPVELEYIFPIIEE